MLYFNESGANAETDASDENNEDAETSSEIDDEIREQYDEYLREDKTQSFEFAAHNKDNVDKPSFNLTTDNIGKILEGLDKESLYKLKEGISAGDKQLLNR